MPSQTAREMLDKALKRRKELILESEALDALINAYQNISGTSDYEVEADGDQLNLYSGMSKRALNAARVAELVDVARRILIAERRPMKRGELVRRLEERGLKLLGADKNKVLGTNLWRSGRFIAVEGQGYWPKDVALPTNADTGRS